MLNYQRVYQFLPITACHSRLSHLKDCVVQSTARRIRWVTGSQFGRETGDGTTSQRAASGGAFFEFQVSQDGFFLVFGMPQDPPLRFRTAVDRKIGGFLIWCCQMRWDEADEGFVFLRGQNSGLWKATCFCHVIRCLQETHHSDIKIRVPIWHTRHLRRIVRQQ